MKLINDKIKRYFQIFNVIVISLFQRSSHKFAIILCPNADLCEQVYKVVKSFKNAVTGDQLVTVRIIPQGMSKYEKRPDIYIGNKLT